MKRRTLITALIACIAAVAAIAPAAYASGSGTTRTIALHGSVSFPGRERQGRLQGQGERARAADRGRARASALAGKHVNVFVNGNKLTSPVVNSLGVAINVNRNTDARHSPSPPSGRGSTVRVRTLGGTMIASGTF